MKQLRSAVILALLLAAMIGCEKLASLQNSKMRIAGEWQKIQMSLPGDDVYDFSERLISINGIEQGSYRFERNSVIEVTLNGDPKIYELEFVDDSKMIWYRKTSKGRDRAHEWVRKK